MSDVNSALMQAGKAISPSANTGSSRKSDSYFWGNVVASERDPNMTREWAKTKPSGGRAHDVYKLGIEVTSPEGRPTGEVKTVYVRPFGVQGRPKPGDIVEIQNNEVQQDGSIHANHFKHFDAANDFCLMGMMKPIFPREDRTGTPRANVIITDSKNTQSLPMSTLRDPENVKAAILQMLQPWKYPIQGSCAQFDAHGKALFGVPRHGIAPVVNVNLMGEDFTLYGLGPQIDQRNGMKTWPTEEQIWDHMMNSRSPHLQAALQTLLEEWPNKIEQMGLTDAQIDESLFQLNMGPAISAQVGKGSLKGYGEGYLDAPTKHAFDIATKPTGKHVTYVEYGGGQGPTEVTKEVATRGFNYGVVRLTIYGEEGNVCADSLAALPYPGRTHVSAPIDEQYPPGSQSRAERRMMREMSAQTAEQTPEQQAKEQNKQQAIQRSEQIESQNPAAQQQAQQQVQQRRAPAQQPAPAAPQRQQAASSAAYDKYGEHAQAAPQVSHVPDVPAHFAEVPDMGQQDYSALIPEEDFGFDPDYQPGNQSVSQVSEQEQALLDGALENIEDGTIAYSEEAQQAEHAPASATTKRPRPSGLGM